MILILLIKSCFFYGQKDAYLSDKDHWVGYVHMNDKLSIPFDFSFNKKETKKGFIIRNGSEKIRLSVKKKRDSIECNFEEVDAFLKFEIDQNTMRGYWLNNNKKEPKRIPFTAFKTRYNKFEISSTSISHAIQLKERYKIIFEKKNKTSIGQFKPLHLETEGTFMTETGDYRFFSGFCFDNKFKLSSFNGNWAMMVEGDIILDSIHGTLYSGISYSTKFKGTYDPDFKLGNPNELTSVVNDKEFDFKGIKTLRNKQFDASKNNGRVVIYQIMGTWCPNCIDEMNYYKELSAKYKKQGLQINAFAYEIEKKNVRTNIRLLKKFKKRMQLNYPIYLAGVPSTKLASSHFPMLNHVMSYPTSIVVDKKGKIRKVHTGFNGPATGLMYKNFKSEMDELVKELLNE